MPMKMEQIECSETSAYIIQTPGNYTKENAYEAGTDRVFRNVGIHNSDAGELPKRKHNIFRTGRKLEIKFLFLQGKAPKEVHAILTETLAFFPSWSG